LDDSIFKRGENLGHGGATFHLSAGAAAINRSVSTVRRRLAGASDKGLIWRFQTAGDIAVLNDLRNLWGPKTPVSLRNRGSEIYTNDLDSLYLPILVL
jgi:hypothetical protein